MIQYLTRYLRGIPNRAAMPNHLFLKRAQRCDSYYCRELQENSSRIWFDARLYNKVPNYIIIRQSDGWELTFPNDELEAVYYSFMKRDKYLMYIIDAIYKRPQLVEYEYDLDSLPSVDKLLGRL